MNAEIITIGDEILIGQIVDTNSQFISKEFNKLGISVYQISSIQDEKEHILNALQEAESRVDLIIITGGLGPTNDDITKHTLAEYLDDKEEVFYQEVYDGIVTMFSKLGHPLNNAQKGQATLPSTAKVLQNKYGTAPGMWFQKKNKVFVSLPGVPYEMKGLMQEQVLPKIHDEFSLPYIYHKTILTYGMGESLIADRIEEWERNLPTGIKLAYLPSFGKVRLRLTAKGSEGESTRNLLEAKTSDLIQLLSDIVVGVDDDESLQHQIHNILVEKGKCLAVAESVTGGKIASSLVGISGASRFFKGGIVAYSAKAKEDLLKVSPQTIEKYSVVSKEVAIEMAENIKEQLGANCSIAVTGNAGPTLDNTSALVGDVYISIVVDDNVICEKFNFGQPREKVINKTVFKSLEMLRKELLKIS